MKRFLIKTTFVSFAVFLCFLLLIILKSYKVKTINWQLPNDIHILFMGASHIEKGINPIQYPNSINIASSSERYMFTYLKLQELFQANKKIDTLFLQFAPTDIQKNTDSKYYQKNEMSHFLPLYSPYFSYQEWYKYKNKLLEVFEIVLQKTQKNIPINIKSFGGFDSSEKNFDRSKEPYKMKKWIEAGHSINYFYLNEIIKLCQNSNVKLIFIYMPMFNKDYFYDTCYFYNQYKTLFINTKFLDYSDWDCPDSYRADEHHLNLVGANAFTKYLYNNINKDNAELTHNTGI
ncbi:hypothetical protein [Formosa sp. S-31]|uniref:hypothetical protein n=1 Tax=Formosa sp. S-31 TaxID=2790949 RepID=UPI003EB74F96